MAAEICDWCAEVYDDTNGLINEAGTEHFCSEECLNNSAENDAANSDQRRNEDFLWNRR